MNWSGQRNRTNARADVLTGDGVEEEEEASFTLLARPGGSADRPRPGSRGGLVIRNGHTSVGPILPL